MAFEFHYRVRLDIVHPSCDPKKISEAITELRPEKEVMVGSERRGKNGQPVSPPRKAACSVWSANLHDEPRLHSGTTPITTFLSSCLSTLERHKGLFAELRKEGNVILVVDWFSDSNHSATLLKAETLQLCGDLGVDLEVGFYSSPQKDSPRNDLSAVNGNRSQSSQLSPLSREISLNDL